MTGKAAPRRSKAKGRPGPDRLDATPERLARASESGQTAERGADRLRRVLDSRRQRRRAGRAGAGRQRFHPA